MSLSDTAVVVLAAGKGTRLKSSMAKVLHRAGGYPLLEHVLRACQPLRARALIVVVGHQADQVGAVAESFGAQPVLQQPQNGTGHAMLMARQAIPASAKHVLVVPGDAPLVRTETLAALMEAQRHAAAAILTANLENPTGYGRILRDGEGEVQAIIEEKSASDEQRAILEVNSSIYSFTLAKLWPSLEHIRPDNFHHELYLTDVIAHLRARGESVVGHAVEDAQEILGCNTRAELAEVDRVFRHRKALALMDAGVTLYLPETILIDAGVEAGEDTVIQPGVQLLGRTRIGARCTIGTGCVLLNAEVADDVEIKPHSLVLDTRLGTGTGVGPFAHLREGTELRPRARIGNFVEVKKSSIGEGTKAMHLTYIGDATVGAGTNIGAGTITCNYDGVNKYPTTIGDRVFIGSGTELVAPVRVGDGAYVAAGSVITQDVPPDSLAIARGRQENKVGWVAERRNAVQARAAAASTARHPSEPAGKMAKVSRRQPKKRPSRAKKVAGKRRG
jgi:bifunctional UDP-N-acetylglucosamine pyrophosphorylase / glucosamine-1-phosphate N-acetyltransferase